MAINSIIRNWRKETKHGVISTRLEWSEATSSEAKSTREKSFDVAHFHYLTWRVHKCILWYSLYARPLYPSGPLKCDRIILIDFKTTIKFQPRAYIELIISQRDNRRGISQMQNATICTYVLYRTSMIK